MNEKYTYEIWDVGWASMIGYIVTEQDNETGDRRVLGGVVCPSYNHAQELLANFLED